MATAMMNEDEQRVWRMWLQWTNRLTARLDQSLRTHAPLELDDLMVLQALAEAADGRLRMSDLAERVCFSRSRLTHRVDRLNRDFLVRRQKCTDDKRGTFAVLTADGRALHDKVLDAHRADVRELFLTRLSHAELAIMADVFTRLALELGAPADLGAVPVS